MMDDSSILGRMAGGLAVRAAVGVGALWAASEAWAWIGRALDPVRAALGG